MKGAFLISSDQDGKVLRRLKRENPRHILCKGGTDDGNINDAIRNQNDSGGFSIPGLEWLRIFQGVKS